MKIVPFNTEYTCCKTAGAFAEGFYVFVVNIVAAGGRNSLVGRVSGLNPGTCVIALADDLYDCG